MADDEENVKASPQILLSTAGFLRQPLRDAFRHAQAAGYEAVEVMVTQDPASRDGRTLRELAARHDLSIEAIHAPFLLLTRRVWSTDPVEKIHRTVQVAEQVGIPLVVVHPPYRWQVRYQQWLERQLSEYTARTGIAVAVENMFPLKLRGDRGIRFHAGQDFDSLDRYPTLVLDTSHLAASGYDILDAYHRYRDKVVHFHLSNNAGKGWDSHLPVYEGVLEMDKLLAAVAADGFAGTLSLELDLRRFFGDDDVLQEVLARNLDFCREHLGVRA
jgi:sugar phosphate isomerase/epimerase